MTAPRLPNLFKVPELKEKILFTLLCLVVYRIGAHIATPGVNVQALADFLRNQGQGTLFSLYDLFAGGSFGRATVFALGIMPYISASIVFQLAAPVFPVVDKMQRDEEGRKKLTQWTRYLTVVLCLFQAYGYALFTEQIPGAVATPGFFFRLTTVLTLTTGGVFVMWLGEQITERGIGNGASLLIFFSIVERIWPETIRTIDALQARSLTFPKLIIVLGVMVLVVAGTVAVTVAARRIPIQIPRKVMGRGRIRHGGLHRRCAVPYHLPRGDLPHGRGHASDRGVEHLQHAVRLRRHGAAHRRGCRARHGHAGATALAVATLRRVHEGRPGQVPRPPAVPVGVRCSSSSWAHRAPGRAHRARASRSGSGCRRSRRATSSGPRSMPVRRSAARPRSLWTKGSSSPMPSFSP